MYEDLYIMYCRAAGTFFSVSFEHETSYVWKPVNQLHLTQFNSSHHSRSGKSH